MTGRTPGEVLGMDGLEKRLTFQIAAELENDRREYLAELVKALGKALGG